MSKQIIILILVIFIIFIILTYRNQENITSDSGKTLSDEALQTIASVYNTQNMIVTNLNATNQTNLKDTKISGNLNVNGIITGNVTGNVTGNINSPNMQYILKMQDDGNIVIYDKDNKPLWSSGNTIRNDKEYAIQSSRKGYLIDGGGWSVPDDRNIDGPRHPWERMRFVEMKTKLNQGDYHWDDK